MLFFNSNQKVAQPSIEVEEEPKNVKRKIQAVGSIDKANSSLSSLFTKSTDKHTLAANLYETNNNLIYVIDVPGITKENITISIDDNRLIVIGRRNVNSKLTNKLIDEIKVGTLKREFTLSGIDKKSLQIDFQNGVLTLTLDKETPSLKTIHIPS